MNTLIRWSAQSGVPPEATSPESKGDYLLGFLKSLNFTVTAPLSHQWNTPTSRPRNKDALGRQIDVVGCRSAFSRHSEIQVDSYMKVGSDHDAVFQRVVFRFLPRKRTLSGSNRPRRVIKEVIQVEGDLDQRKLADLAQTCTRPISGHAYVDPPEVKVFFQIARQSRSAEAWKRALRGRKEARRLWTEGKIVAAAKGDWGSYKIVAKKGSAGWEGHLAQAGRERGPSSGGS